VAQDARADYSARVPNSPAGSLLLGALRRLPVHALSRAAGRLAAVQLPAPLRTERWQSVCDGLERWRALSVDARTRLAVLLHSLCLYDPVVSLVPAPGTRLGRDQLDAIDLIYWRESARYIVGLPRKVSDYRDADLSVFETIATEGSNAIPAGFNAAVKVFVHKAKTRAPVDELVSLADRMERIHADTASKTDPFTSELLTSRFYRALALLPQRQGDRMEAVRQMDLAEQHARALKPKTSAQELLYLENLHRVLPKGHFLPTPSRSRVVFGSPLRLEDGESKPDFLERARQALLDLRRP